MKLVLVVFIVTAAVFTVADKKFHEELTKDHLIHYFGTSLPHKVPDYEFVEPVALAVNKSLVSNTEEKQFRINAFGTIYNLLLARNEHLVAPGCLVIKTLKNGTREISGCLQNELHCYYHGRSLNHNDSAVAVSTCIGVNGIISVQGHDLMIQPIREEHKSRVRRHTSITTPHIVYRRSTETGDRCGKPDTPVFTEKPLIKTRRRRASQTFYAEMKAVMAPDAFKYHGDDALRYLLTTINIAAQRFKDSSMPASIDFNIAIVEIKLMQHDEPDLTITDDASALLTNFCEWQEKSQPISPSDPRHADGALLVTRMDLQYRGNKQNLGLGHKGGMCKPKFRCSVNEDSGLDMGLTIAHEIGHTLGLSHDGEGNSCEQGKNIMSPNGAYGTTALKWSQCSAEGIRNFLSLSSSSCLVDKPTGLAIGKVNYNQKPGIMFTANEQCQLAMDEKTSTVCEGSTLTPGGNECQRLVCYGPKSVSHMRNCYGVGSTRLDGTECGHRKWCIGGQCVDMRAGDPAPIDGGWSSLDSDWSLCSRSCGGGVKVKSRKCNNPEPRFGGKDCQGDSVLAIMCNIQPCVNSSTDYRAEQCAATNSRPFNGRLHHWKPYDVRIRNENDACILRCYDAQAGIVVVRGEGYADGTKCASNAAFARCVSHSCKTFGCDGHMNSGLSFDKCGVCNGDGSTCSVHTGTYNQGRPKEYVTYVSVPKGATSIQATNKNRYCHMTVKVEGQVMFSRSNTFSLSGTYTRNGVIVQYRKAHGSPEAINILGPLPVAIELQVWRDYGAGFVGVAPDISYSYYTPKNSHRSSHHWITEYGTCSRTCGTGTKLPKITCVRTADNVRVVDMYCNIFQRPIETPVECNTSPCPPGWRAENWNTCSKTCGGGTKIRSVNCVVIQRDEHTDVAASKCNARAKPATSSSCNTQECPGVWKASSWSACSVTCGRGVKNRTLACHSAVGNSVVDPSLCPPAKPATSEHCMDIPCNLDITGDDCFDQVDCDAYPSNVCEVYGPWSKSNCAEFCGICAKDPSIYTCKDKIDCSVYASDTCSNFESWSRKNCARTCHFCTGDVTTQHSDVGDNSCVDVLDCSSYQEDTCTNPAYRSWAEQNCKKHCGFCDGGDHSDTDFEMTTSGLDSSCQDKTTCEEYDADTCTNDNYRDWAHENCPHFCGFCGDTNSAGPSDGSSGSGTAACEDKIDDCVDYGKSACTGYRSWAAENCQKFCNLCGATHRKRRSLPLTKDEIEVGAKMQNIDLVPKKLIPDAAKAELKVQNIKLVPRKRTSVDDKVIGENQVPKPPAIPERIAPNIPVLPKVPPKKYPYKQSSQDLPPIEGGQVIQRVPAPANKPKSSGDLPPVEGGKVVEAVPAPETNLIQLEEEVPEKITDNTINAFNSGEIGEENSEEEEEVPEKISDNTIAAFNSGEIGVENSEEEEKAEPDLIKELDDLQHNNM